MYLMRISIFASKVTGYYWQASYDPGHNILEFDNMLAQVYLPQVKQNLIFSIKYLVYELIYEFPNNLGS